MKKYRVTLTICQSVEVEVETSGDVSDACSLAWKKYEAGDIPEEDWYETETNACVEGYTNEEGRM